MLPTVDPVSIKSNINYLTDWK